MNAMLHPVIREALRQKLAANHHISETGCWVWMKALNGSGYGSVGVPRCGILSRSIVLLAHRAAYELFRDEIPRGLQIDHLCRNRACINPDHMEVVTGRENKMRGDTITRKCATATHCPAGHPYDGDNLRVTSGGRRCIECDRKRSSVAHRRRQAAAGKIVGLANASKTHCPNGHEYTPENTHLQPHNGARICRACDRERTAKRRTNAA